MPLARETRPLDTFKVGLPRWRRAGVFPRKAGAAFCLPAPAAFPLGKKTKRGPGTPMLTADYVSSASRRRLIRHIRPKVFGSVRNFATSPEVDKVRSNSVEFAPKLTNLAQRSPKQSQLWCRGRPDICRIWAMMRHHRRNPVKLICSHTRSSLPGLNLEMPGPDWARAGGSVGQRPREARTRESTPGVCLPPGRHQGTRDVGNRSHRIAAPALPPSATHGSLPPADGH